MNIRTFDSFQLVLLCCLCLGTLIVESPIDNRNWIIMIVFYTIAFLAQKRIFGDQFLGKKEEVTPSEMREKDKIYYGGEYLETRSEKYQEIQTLSEIFEKKKQLSIKAITVLLLLALIYYSATRRISFHFELLLQLACVSMIVPAASLGQFLIPLGFNCFLVIVSTFSSHHLSYFVYAGYCILFIATLIAYKWVDFELGDPDANFHFHKKEKLIDIQKRGALESVFQALVFMGIAAVVNFIVTDFNNLHEKTKSHAARLASEVQKKIAIPAPEPGISLQNTSQFRKMAGRILASCA